MAAIRHWPGDCYRVGGATGLGPKAWIQRYIYEDARRRPAVGRHAPHMPKFVPSLALILFAGALLGWVIFFGFALLAGASGWPWYPHFDKVGQDKLLDAIKSAVTALGVIGGVFAVVYAYRKQRIEEAGGHRLDAEQLSKRYQDAAEQLGHEKAAVRLAGVYSMARLADEWPEQRQVCIDVLCAYIRMPASESDTHDQHVRRAIFSVIRQHLQKSAEPSWSELMFDFTEANFCNLELDGAIFKTRPIFTRAQFSASCSLASVQFLRGVELQRIKISGDFSLTNVVVKQGALDVDGFTLQSGRFDVAVTGFDDISWVMLGFATISGGKFSLYSIHMAAPRSIFMNHVTVSGQAEVFIGDRPYILEPAPGPLCPVEAKQWVVGGGRVALAKRLSDAGALNWEPQSVADGTVTWV